MDVATSAIVPVVALLAMGFVLRHRFLTEPALWSGLEKISYYLFTPALFVTSISTTDLSTVRAGPLVLSLTAPLALTTGILLLLRRPLRASGPDITSVVQGAIRINTYVGLILMGSLYSTEGVAVFALACAVVVPTVNLLCVGALTAFGEPERPGEQRPSMLRSLATNPYLLACLLGLALNLGGITIPDLLFNPLKLLAQPAMVVGTLVSGAALSLRISARDTAHIAVASVFKLALVPVAGTWIATSMGVTGTALAAIVVILSIPTATSATILSSIMGGNTRLMASITAAQTVLSVFTLPVALAVLL